MSMLRELGKFSKNSFKPDEKSAGNTQFKTPLNITKKIVESAVANQRNQRKNRFKKI
jgi:hypothetical protein